MCRSAVYFRELQSYCLAKMIEEDGLIELEF